MVVRRRNTEDYGYPTTDVEVLTQKALEVTRRLTDLYGVAEWSKKTP